LEARFEVASKEADLGPEERNVQLLALVYVSDGASRVYGGSVGVVMPRSGQRYDMVRGGTSHILFFPWRLCLLEGSEMSVHAFYCQYSLEAVKCL